MGIEEKIELIADTFEAENIAPDTALEELENWDSMGKLSLIVMCDDEFGKKLTADDIKGFVTVQDILDFLA